MSFQFSGEAAAFIATSNTILLDHGIDVRVGTDFDEYKEIIREHRPVQILGAPFDPANQVPEQSELVDGNAFWLTGWSDEGELIHTQAAKGVDLKGRALSNYLLNGFRRFPPPFKDIDFARSRFRATPGSHKISGTVVYHGEVWMAPEQGRYRGSGLSTVLARTGLLHIMRRWNPDWMYGFMLRAVAFKGFSERMGYMHNEPGALLWYRDGKETPAEAFLTYLSREDVMYLLDMPVRELVSQAA